jgi:hypothetical protein
MGDAQHLPRPAVGATNVGHLHIVCFACCYRAVNCALMHSQLGFLLALLFKVNPCTPVIMASQQNTVTLSAAQVVGPGMHMHRGKSHVHGGARPACVIF